MSKINPIKCWHKSGNNLLLNPIPKPDWRHWTLDKHLKTGWSLVSKKSYHYLLLTHQMTADPIPPLLDQQREVPNPRKPHPVTLLSYITIIIPLDLQNTCPSFNSSQSRQRESQNYCAGPSLPYHTPLQNTQVGWETTTYASLCQLLAN